MVMYDLKGQVFNRLSVVCLSKHKPDGQLRWDCICECGNKTIVATRDLRKGRVKSCGCLERETLQKRNKGNKYGLIHGYSHHPLRAIRKAMIHRCYKNTNPFHYSYGARGIKVCDQWKESLINFMEWALSTGWVKGLSIDRINEDGDYTPENCRWITIQENSKRNMLKLWKSKWKDRLLSPIDSFPGLISSTP